MNISRRRFLAGSTATGLFLTQTKWPMLSQLFAEGFEIPKSDADFFNLEEVEQMMQRIDNFGVNPEALLGKSIYQEGMSLEDFFHQLKTATKAFLGAGKELYNPEWTATRAIRTLPAIDAWLAFTCSLLKILVQECKSYAFPVSTEDKRVTKGDLVFLATSIRESFPVVTVNPTSKSSSTFKLISPLSYKGKAAFDVRYLGMSTPIYANQHLDKIISSAEAGSVDAGSERLLTWLMSNLLEGLRFKWKSIYSLAEILNFASRMEKKAPQERERLGKDNLILDCKQRFFSKTNSYLFSMQISVMRMRLLAKTYSSGIYTSNDRQYAQREVSSLIDGLQVLHSSARFADRKIFQSRFSVKTPEGNLKELVFNPVHTDALNLTRYGSKMTVSTMEFSGDAVDLLDEALTKLQRERMKLKEVFS